MASIIGRNLFTSNLVFQMLFGTPGPHVGSRTQVKLWKTGKVEAGGGDPVLTHCIGPSLTLLAVLAHRLFLTFIVVCWFPTIQQVSRKLVSSC